MPNTTTTNYAWTLIEVGANADQWGSLLNTNTTDIDADLFAVSTVANAALPKAGGTMTGVIVGTTPAAGGAGYASFRFPHGTAPTDNLANGDMWTTTAGAFLRINGSTKTLAFTDSSITGNAGTATALATPRTIAMTGDVVWTSAAFDGTGNVTGTAEIQAGVITATELATNAVTTAKITDNNVTLAKIETIANNRLLGNVSGGAAAPSALTGAQASALLNLASIPSATQSFPTPDWSNPHSGYFKVGDIYIQFGFALSANASLTTVTFPVTFPTACLSVIVTPHTVLNGYATNNVNQSVRVFNVYGVTNGSFTGYSSAEILDIFTAKSFPFTWIAIGH